MNRIFTAIFIVLFSSSVFGEDTGNNDVNRPLPICGTITDFGAYKLTAEIINTCNAIGISMNFKNVQSGFKNLIESNNSLSTLDCSAKCLVLDAVNNTDMSACVENSLVNPFVEGFMESANLDESRCNKVKTEFGG